MTRSFFLSLALVLSGASHPLHGTAQGAARAFPSYAVLTADGDRLAVTGVVVDAESGVPLRDAQIRFGDGGSLSNTEGWFRVQVSSVTGSVTIAVARIGYHITPLTITREDGQRRFFVVPEDISFCEAMLRNGPQPGRVSLHVRDLSTGLPLEALAEVVATNANSLEAYYDRVSAKDGAVPTGIDAPGAYELSISVQGYAPLLLGPFVVRTENCATNRVRSQVQSVWLQPLN